MSLVVAMQSIQTGAARVKVASRRSALASDKTVDPS